MDHPEKMTQEYDRRYAGDYMDTDDYSVWARDDLNSRQVMETLGHIPGEPGSILDFGCGVGGWIPVIAHVFPHAALTGVEISGNAVEKARLRFPHHRFHHLEGSRSPLDDESFDLVFSYHVLEHVGNITDSVSDIARLVKKGGHACIIFPCGNPGSLLDRLMGLIADNRKRSKTGELAYFFEIPDGHVRRLTSDETIELFRRQGMEVVNATFSGHFFGTIDWLARGTGPAYINRVFRTRKASTRFGQLRLDMARGGLLGLHRFLNRRSMDLTKRRPPVKQAAVFLVRSTARAMDATLSMCSSLEWRMFKKRPSGSAQYLVFRKP